MLTKARSKAAKRARRRGRPRLPAKPGDREPNGCLTRRKNGAEARVMDVALNQRIRQLRLDGDRSEILEQAKDPRRGYVLGLMLLDGVVDEVQHDAGLRYARDMSRWFALCVGRFPSVRAQNLVFVPGRAAEREDHVEAALHARRTVAALHGILRAQGRRHRPPGGVDRPLGVPARHAGVQELARASADSLA